MVKFEIMEHGFIICISIIINITHTNTSKYRVKTIRNKIALKPLTMNALK